MDSGTHAVMGISLGGLATIQPAIASDPTLASAVMIATVVGSQAPDLITAAILLFYDDVKTLPILFWAFIAVALHVFVDIFNAYGTQALRPFSKRWIALGIINIFDPFIFLSHALAILLWVLGLEAAHVFIPLYLINILYYVWRIHEKRKVVQHAKKLHPDATHVFVSPTIRWNQWHLVIRTPEVMFVAESKNGEIEYFEQYSFDPIPDIPVINAARKDPNLSAFLSFSPTYRWEIDDSGEFIEVRFIDLRYRSKGHYPFVAIVQLDDDLNVVNSYTGWVYREKTLKKKLNIANE